MVFNDCAILWWRKLAKTTHSSWLDWSDPYPQTVACPWERQHNWMKIPNTQTHKYQLHQNNPQQLAWLVWPISWQTEACSLPLGKTTRTPNIKRLDRNVKCRNTQTPTTSTQIGKILKLCGRKALLLNCVFKVCHTFYIGCLGLGLKFMGLRGYNALHSTVTHFG